MSVLRTIAGQAAEQMQGIINDIVTAQSAPTNASQTNADGDWRVRLSLAPGSNYLYNAPDNLLLAPLRATDGVIFPYMPNINVSYTANYDSIDPTHSNYRIHQYRNSAVDQVSISCDFTAQDTAEANYVLAVIHFFRSITKMFYGQDGFPRPGTPPPLCFMHGLGAYQFDKHPLLITNFVYNLPADVDYIRAGINATPAGSTSPLAELQKEGNVLQRIGSAIRLAGRILPGGNPVPTKFSPPPPGAGEGTYVPTKISIQISALPVVSRAQISNEFSLDKYAKGDLLRGSKRNGGGIW